MTHETTGTQPTSTARATARRHRRRLRAAAHPDRTTRPSRWSGSRPTRCARATSPRSTCSPGLRHHPGQSPPRRQDDPRPNRLRLPGRYPAPGRHRRRLPQTGGRARRSPTKRSQIGAKVLWMQLGIVNEEADRDRPRGRAGRGPEPLRQDRARPLLRRPQSGRHEHRRDHLAPDDRLIHHG